MKLTEEDQAAQDELERARKAVEGAARPPRKGPPVNRAALRRRGVGVGTWETGRMFRRPSTRPIREIDPTPAQRPSTHLHGRTRYGQERAETEAAAAYAATQPDRTAALEQLARLSRNGGKPTIDEAARDREALGLAPLTEPLLTSGG